MSGVRIDCPCAPKNGPQGESVRHPEGDTVTLRPMLDFRAGMTARNAVMLARSEDPDLSSAEILTILTEIYVLQGIESWTLVDEKGKPLEVTRPAIRERILSNQTRALTIGDAADALYAEAVMLPLLATGSSSSPDTQTEPSTSATNGSPVELPKRSRRSSTSTSRMDGTATTTSPLGGAYS